ncbi:MAG: tetratricopeptide repeat-containing sensor histidine kinase [Microscillaceae bacterium]|nr:tetratricopeptide repeat-containing sensor histidine kinase [Microscillaceae bacterium]
MLVLICWLFASHGASQNLLVIDSLKKRLNTLKIDTLKAQTLISLTRELYALEPSQATRYAQQCIQLSKKNKYPRGEATALHYLGLASQFAGDNLKAMDYYLQSLRLSEKAKILDIIAINLSRIANINKDEGDFKKSLELHNQAIAILRKINHRLYLSYALNQMGLLQLSQKKYALALRYFEEALTISTRIKDQRHIAICWYYTAEVYLMSNRYQKALECYKQSQIINRQINNLLLLASTYNNIARIHLSNQQMDSVFLYAQNALSVAQKVNLKPEIMSAYYYLAQSYQAKNKLDSAFRYQSLWATAKDSLFNEHKNKQILLLQNTYREDKQKLEIAQQKSIIGQRNTTIYAFLIVLLLILFIVFLLYRNNLRKHRLYLKLEKQTNEISQQKLLIESQNTDLQVLNEEITQQKEEISAFNNQLEMVVEARTTELNIAIDNLSQKNQDLEQFSYIVSHNLRAPVARVMGLVNILDKDNMSEYNLGIIKHLETTAGGLDTVIRDLTQIIAIRNSLDKVNEPVDLEQTTHLVVQHLKNELETTKTDLTLDFAAGKQIFTVKSYAQSIIHNLLSNAIKYRHPKRASVIEICTQIADNYLILSVKDQGIGIDLAKVDNYKIFGLYQRMATHVEGKGLGLYLVKSQIESLGGKIEVESTPNQGSNFKVYFLNQPIF